MIPEILPEPENRPTEGVDSIRLQKLQTLREAGRDPFAQERFDVTHHAAEIVAEFDRLDTHTVFAAGRITASRVQGKVAFLDLTDATGRIQLYARRDEIGEELFEDIKHNVDLGDIVGVSGFVFRTQKGEISIHVREWTLLAKSLRPLPFGKEYETDEGEEKPRGRPQRCRAAVSAAFGGFIGQPRVAGTPAGPHESGSGDARVSRRA